MTTMTIEQYKNLGSKKSTSKYRNKKEEYNGRIFDSKAEADYARRLDWLRHAHELGDRVIHVEYQVPYRILMSGKYIGTYFADFRVMYGDRRQEVVDVKGYRTPVYKLKKQLVEAQYGIEIIEV